MQKIFSQNKKFISQTNFCHILNYLALFIDKNSGKLQYFVTTRYMGKKRVQKWQKVNFL